jgi:hypothetical protein
VAIIASTSSSVNAIGVSQKTGCPRIKAAMTDCRWRPGGSQLSTASTASSSRTCQGSGSPGRPSEPAGLSPWMLAAPRSPSSPPRACQPKPPPVGLPPIQPQAGRYPSRASAGV